MRRFVTTVGLVIVAITLVANFRLRDPVAELEALVELDDPPAVVTPTTSPPSTPPTTLSARALALMAATSTTTTTTLAPLPTTPGAVSFIGPEIDTRFGPMQVEIVVSGGVIEDVIWIKQPGETRTSRMLTRILWPVYRDWTIERQNADVDFTSSATVTWEAYIESLEGAIEAAGLT